MANLVYRTTNVPDSRSTSIVKNAELTYQELDSNFILLNEQISNLESDLTTANAKLNTISVKQIVSSQYSTNEDINGIIPLDNTKPQNTEGVEIVTLNITPKKTSSSIWLEFDATVVATDSGTVIVAVFVDSSADALAATAINVTSAEQTRVNLKVKIPSGTVLPRDYKVRVGTDTSNTIRFNGTLSGALFGGIMSSLFTATETE